MLQGWKLFAEAHRIQAGDQVSFELVAFKRMVVQVIRAADTPVCKKGYPYSQKARAPKALKNHSDSSPQGSQQYFCDSEEVRLVCFLFSAPISVICHPRFSSQSFHDASSRALHSIHAMQYLLVLLWHEKPGCLYKEMLSVFAEELLNTV